MGHPKVAPIHASATPGPARPGPAIHGSRSEAKTVKRLPLAARTLVALVAAAGAAILLVRIPDLARWGGADLAAFALLAAGIALAEQFQIPLCFGSETLNFSLTEAVWVGGLVLARPSVVTM